MSSTLAHSARPNPHAAIWAEPAPMSVSSIMASLSRLKQRLLAYREELAELREKEDLLRRARRYAETSPSYAADLLAAAGRSEFEYEVGAIDPILG